MISLEQINDALEKFDISSLTRSYEYLDPARWSGLTVRDSEMFGIVKGSSRQPYETKVVFGPRSSRSVCSCPVGLNCKHAAALLRIQRDKLLHAQLIQSSKSAELHAVEPVPLVVSDPGQLLPAEVRSWLDQLVELARPEPDDYPEGVLQRTFYLLDTPGSIHESPHLSVVTVAPTKSGGYSIIQRNKLAHVSTVQRPKHMLREDVDLINQLSGAQTHFANRDFFELKGDLARIHLTRLIETSRCFFKDPNSQPLKWGEPRAIQYQWKSNKSKKQNLDISIQGGGHLLWLKPLMYLDSQSGEIGELDFGPLSEPMVRHLLKAPKLTLESATPVARLIMRAFPDLPELAPEALEPPEVRSATPKPRFVIARETITEHSHLRTLAVGTRTMPVAHIEFVYDKVVTRHESPKSNIIDQTEDPPVQYLRNLEEERKWQAQLADLLWVPMDFHKVVVGRPKSNVYYLFAPLTWPDLHPVVDRWSEFVAHQVPKMQAAGWEVEIDPRLSVAGEVDLSGLTAKISSEAGNEWFQLSLDIEVDGKTVPLLPVLLALIRAYPIQSLLEIPDENPIRLNLTESKSFLVPAGRIKPILTTLAELFADRRTNGVGLEISNADLALLAEFDSRVENGLLEWEDPDNRREVAKKLKEFKEIEVAPLPIGLRAELRSYQHEGLSWLQFLREYGFGGILADDMGLGKTIQTLAHLSLEKEKGRLTKPALIVAPTSTLPNWRAEVDKFAPDLRVLVLHGTDRKQHFAHLAEYDLVLTSYPLLVRDRAVLEQVQFSVIVLDEAQYVKNIRAGWTQAAGALKADQRICLSGTPIENHLGELWSLFTFLSPGFLGTAKMFSEQYRTPIEKFGDAGTRESLARRIRPFLLRRTKAEVAAELPAKVEIVERVELQSDQRDLYETVRASVDERVRQELAARGLGRSSIIVLDALLKLRQVCCDPQLVNLDIAHKAKHSAKRERLMEMLPSMIEDGRRVLVFSQFTSMLDLLEVDLNELGIPFVRISGETQDRRTPVERFQAGEVPLFLISLKAGGTGLNLTAADTVIHYDPWWNPAVENQATDRAHRIGQDKTVFVYKLIASGTVEEKIQELQVKKAALADALLENRLDSSSALSQEDLDWILAPISSDPVFDEADAEF